jgi:hypothetical protein
MSHRLPARHPRAFPGAGPLTGVHRFAVAALALNKWRENQSSRWTIYIFRSKLQWLGEVEAASAEEAIVKGAEAFGQNAKRLMAVRR